MLCCVVPASWIAALEAGVDGADAAAVPLRASLLVTLLSVCESEAALMLAAANEGVAPSTVDAPAHQSQLLVYCLQTVLAEASRLIAKEPSAVAPPVVCSLFAECLGASYRLLTQFSSLNLEAVPTSVWSVLDVRARLCGILPSAVFPPACSLTLFSPRLDVLQSAFVGPVLLTLSSFISVLIDVRPAAVVSIADGLKQDIANITTLMNSITPFLPSSLRLTTVVSNTSKTVTEVRESGHPYANSLVRCGLDHMCCGRVSHAARCDVACTQDETTAVQIPGATQITITFDAQTRTETNCDYLRFMQNGSTLQDFTGRDDARRFPGLDTTPPLVINGDSYTTLFHSDGSCTGALLLVAASCSRTPPSFASLCGPGGWQIGAGSTRLWLWCPPARRATSPTGCWLWYAALSLPAARTSRVQAAC